MFSRFTAFIMSTAVKKKKVIKLSNLFMHVNWVNFTITHFILDMASVINTDSLDTKKVMDNIVLFETNLDQSCPENSQVLNISC